MKKTTILRNSMIRSIHGGYGRLVDKDGVLGNSVFIKKFRVFRVVRLNQYTQTVIVSEEPTGITYSLEYDYVLNDCEEVDHDPQGIINGLAIIDFTKETYQEPKWIPAMTLALLWIELFLTLLLLTH